MRDGWPVIPLGDLVERVTKKNSQGIDRVFSVSAEHGLIDQEEFFNKRVASRDLTKYTVVDPGSYVYSKSYSRGAPVGAVVRNKLDVPGVVSPIYIVFRVTSEALVDGFLDLAVKSTVYAQALGSMMKEGGRAHGGINISLKDYFSTPVPLPPIQEQRRIVDLISSIDQAVERGGRLEQQLDAVRGQLLADVLSPREGWQETTVGEIASITIGRTPPRNDSRYWTTSLERPFCTIADLTSHTVPTREGVTDLAEKEGKARRAPQGSLLFSFKLTIGRVGFAGVDLFPNEAIAIINPLADEIDKRYLGLALEMQDWATAGARAVKGNTLNRQSLEAIPIPLPPLSEQRRIAELISSVDKAADQVEKFVSVATSLRSQLLADLLSGSHRIPDSYDHLLEDAS